MLFYGDFTIDPETMDSITVINGQPSNEKYDCLINGQEAIYNIETGMFEEDNIIQLTEQEFRDKHAKLHEKMKETHGPDWSLSQIMMDCHFSSPKNRHSDEI